MTWFGKPWPSDRLRAPVCEDENERVPTPIGAACLWCGEPIIEGDRGQFLRMATRARAVLAPAHIECLTRQALGGPAHWQGVCSCQGGTCDPDMGMSERQAALWVWDHIQTGFR